jgi:vancomycin resistance protein YoaR
MMNVNATAKIQNSVDIPVFLKLFLAFIVSLLVFGLLAMVLLIGFEIAYANRIYPNVYVNDIDLSGLSLEEAYSRLSEDIAYTYEGQIEITYQGQGWQATPLDLGYRVDLEVSAQQAYNVGRRRWLIPNLIEKGRAWFEGVQLSPVALYDERIAQNFINAIADEINVPVEEAALSLEGTEVIVQSGQVGRQVDVDRSLAAIAVALQAMENISVPLVVDETPPVILDASAQAELAHKILSEPLELVAPAVGEFEEENWTITPDSLANLLVISRSDHEIGEESTYEITLNESQFTLYLNGLVSRVKVEPVNTRFMFNDDTRELEVIKPAVIGRNLNIQSSLDHINEQLQAGEHTITLQFDTVTPEITDAVTGEELGIVELVEERTTYFYGSDAARVQNIETAAAQFHGLLIPPGATFSMAQALGNISLENGYAEALIIYGGQTIQGVGGGVCQVSTTLFRTAFFAGFPIVERHAHAYRVSYYEYDPGRIRNPQWAGFDATVYVPIVDLKFTNDTDHWLLMETYVYRGSEALTWKFYSTDDGRTVEWNTTGPRNIVDAPEPLYRENPDLQKGVIKQVDYAADGADINVTRTVYKGGSIHFSDSFFTHFRPWQEINEYGPGTDVPDSD